VTAGIFALLLGGLGVHHFYLGSTPLGVLYLALYLGGCGTGFFVCGIPWAFSGVVGILALIEGILLLVMPDPEFDRRYNQRTRGPMEFVFTKPPAPPPAA
jgi:TM2 domain-containing membrane protein YozV